MSFFQILYVSRAREGTSVLDAQDILTVSQKNNGFDSLTGCLLFSGRHFSQILEGTLTNINDLVIKISADRRHEDMCILFGHNISFRQYPRWTMTLIHNPAADATIAHLLNKKQVLPITKLLALMAEVESWRPLRAL